MHFPKNYLHDRIVLLLLSLNTFLAFLGTVLIFLRLDGARNSGYIAEYRANLGISPFKPGHLVDLLAFIVFAFLIVGIHLALSMRMFAHHRHYALSILAMGTLLLVLTIIVSNSLLILR